MSYAFANVGQRENQESLEYVSGADAAYIDVNDARAIFDEVIEALSLTGEDTSNIVFDEGFGYSERGRTKSTTDFQRFKGARSQVPGSYNPRTGVVTIYRNAFSTTIGNIQTSPGELGWQSFFAEAGFQSGLFITGHELGHRIHNHNYTRRHYDFEANRYGRSVYRRVFQGDPRC